VATRFTKGSRTLAKNLPGKKGVYAYAICLAEYVSYDDDDDDRALALGPYVKSTSAAGAVYSDFKNLEHGEEDVSEACETGQLVTSCSSSSKHKGTRNGAYASSDSTCVAAGSGERVTSEAICATFTNATIWDQVVGSWNPVISVASCKRGYVLTGCSCHGEKGRCDNGARPLDSTTCEAWGTDGKEDVRAVAICVQSDAQTSLMIGHLSGTGDDAGSQAWCDSRSRSLPVGCSCFTGKDTRSCEGAYLFEDHCVARNMKGGKGVHAVAICMATKDAAVSKNCDVPSIRSSERFAQVRSMLGVAFRRTTSASSARAAR